MAFTVTDKFRVRLGGNTYIDVRNLVVYDNQTLFTLKRHEDGYLGIYFELYDADGTHVASVKRNVLYFDKETDRSGFEERGSMNWYQLVEKGTGRVVVDIKKRVDAEPNELEVSVRLFTQDGFLFDATPDETHVGGVYMRNNTLMNLAVGIDIAKPR